MKLPRDLSGTELATALKRIGYTIHHQTGSHMRLSIETPFQHRVTIPAHKQLRVGTLAAILDAVAAAAKMDRLALQNKLFE